MVNQSDTINSELNYEEPGVPQSPDLIFIDDIHGVFTQVTSIPTWIPNDNLKNSYAYDTTNKIWYVYNFITKVWDSFTQAITPTDATLTTSDITTNDVTSTKHGWAPKSPDDSTYFLNGGNTPGYTQPPTGLLQTITTGNDITNTVTETDIFTAYLVPANTMGIANTLHCRLFFSDFHNQSGSGATLVFKVKWGNTLFITTGSFNPGDNQVHLGFIDITVMENGAANSQKVFMQAKFIYSNSGVLFESDTTAERLMEGMYFGTTGGSTTIDQNFKVTAKWSAAQANNHLVFDSGYIEIIK